MVTADNVDESVRIDGFTITEGSADGGGDNSFGGGMFVLNANPSIVRCTFTANLANAHGGGAVGINNNSLPLFVNCSFIDNVAGEGGAIHTEFLSAAATFVNCLFAGNHAINYEERHGGAIDHGNSTGDITLINCTLTENLAGLEGGAINLHDGGDAIVFNSILWGNTPDEIFVQSGTGIATVTYSDVEGGWGIPADMNIDEDPFFVNGTYRLGFGSECIEKGNPNEDVIPDDNFDVDQNGITMDQLTPDLDLHARIANAFVDMGSYEHCLYDLDESGSVGTGDLLILLLNWTTPEGSMCDDCDDCAPSEPGNPDFNDDCKVSTPDLLALLANWGWCGDSAEVPLTVTDCVNRFFPDYPLALEKCLESVEN